MKNSEMFENRILVLLLNRELKKQSRSYVHDGTNLFNRFLLRFAEKFKREQRNLKKIKSEN